MDKEKEIKQEGEREKKKQEIKIVYEKIKQKTTQIFIREKMDRIDL